MRVTHEGCIRPLTTLLRILAAQSTTSFAGESSHLACFRARTPCARVLAVWGLSLGLLQGSLEGCIRFRVGGLGFGFRV